jgi:PKD repeat protein
MSNKNRERAAGASVNAIANAVQAAFEAMETRRLLSTVQVADGVLVIDADPHTASNIIVDLHAPEGRIRGYCAGVEATFAAADVKSIRITGSDGDDTVIIDKRLTIPTLIRTGAGNDRVRGGGGVDTVDAGPGKDRLRGARGDDRLSGGDDNDVIYGCVGHDLIDGGAGNDRLYGQAGDDTIYGGEGFDLLAGLGGDDKIYAGDGDDRAVGNGGDDQIFGGAGNDRLNGRKGRDQLVGGDGLDRIGGGHGKNRVSSGGSNGQRPSDDLTKAPDIENLPVQAPVGSDDPAGDPTEGENTGGDTTTPPPVDNTPPEDNTPPSDPTDHIGDDDSTPPATDGKTPKPVIRMIGDADLIAGGTVHVHGLESQMNGGTVIQGRFDWDFGDPSGQYNTLAGFNAAHVYNDPGVYTITLQVTNEAGRSAVATVKVNVTADVRATVYVDSAFGDDDNDGASPASAVRTAKKAFDLAGDDTRILFKRGQKFTIDQTMMIEDDRVLVGAYGTGSLPVLYRVKGEGEAVIRTTADAEDAVIEDLRFDSPYKADPNGAVEKIPVTAVVTGGTNITVRDSEFGDVGNGVNANMDPHGLLVMNTVVTTSYGVRSYHVWGEGTDLVVLGNKSTNSTREHIVRTSGVDRQLVAYNDFGQLRRGDVDPKDIEKGCIEIHRGSYAYIFHNVTHGGLIRLGPRGGGYETQDTATDWSVIEDNYCDDEGIHLYPGTHHAMIRNNVIEKYDSLKWGAAIAINPASTDHRVSSDIYILNNTVIERRASGQFLRTFGKEWGDQITLKNNVWINDNFRPGNAGSAAVYVTEDNLRSFREVSGNVWTAPKSAAGNWAKDGVAYLAAEWGDQAGYITAQQWNAEPEVGTDYFTNRVTLKDTYQVKINGTIAGSTMKIAA